MLRLRKMKNLLLGVALGILLAFVPLAYTQQAERISVGTVGLQLGMEKDAVISRLAERGYKLSKLEGSDNQSEQWVVSERTEQAEYELRGSLLFTKGRLSVATRGWADSWDVGSAKIARSLYFLVKSFEESGNTSCSVETKPQEGPEIDSKESLIRCGRRTIIIGVSKYKEQHEETQLSETVK